MKQLFIGSENVLSQMEHKKINYGDFISNDRFFTIVNQFIDDNLLRYSKLLCFCVVYLFRSSNYRHINFKKRKIIYLIRTVDLLCWICFLIFIVLTIIGITSPIIHEIKQFNFHKIFQDATITWIFVLELACIFISFCYMFILRRKIAANRKMSITDYVTAKIGLIINLDFLFKIRSRIYRKMETEKIKRNITVNTPFTLSKVYTISGLEKITSLSEIWLIMQVTNVMYYLFNDFNLVLVIKSDDENFIKQIQMSIHHDFQQMQILITNN